MIVKYCVFSNGDSASLIHAGRDGPTAFQLIGCWFSGNIPSGGSYSSSQCKTGTTQTFSINGSQVCVVTSCPPPTNTRSRSQSLPRTTSPPQSANPRSAVRSSTQSSVAQSLSQSLSASPEQSPVGTATVPFSLSLTVNHSTPIGDSLSFVFSSLLLGSNQIEPFHPTLFIGGSPILIQSAPDHSTATVSSSPHFHHSIVFTSTVDFSGTSTVDESILRRLSRRPRAHKFRATGDEEDRSLSRAVNPDGLTTKTTGSSNCDRNSQLPFEPLVRTQLKSENENEAALKSICETATNS
jgi:hypothetical protein